MSDHLDRAAAIVGGCCAHCDDLVDERLALLDEAGLLATPERDAAVAAKALREAAEKFATGDWADAWLTDGVDDDVSAVRSTDRWFNDRADRIEREAGESRDEAIRADERGRCSVVHATLDDEALVAELVRRGVLREERVGDNRVCRCTAHRSDPVLIAPCEAHEPITLPTRYVTAWEEVGRDE